jgi:hypothetical protein
MNRTPGYRYPDVSLFLTAMNADYELVVIHCLRCGLPIAQMNAHVVTYVDNPGPQNTREIFVRVFCKRCPSVYRLFVPRY